MCLAEDCSSTWSWCFVFLLPLLLETPMLGGSWTLRRDLPVSEDFNLLVVVARRRWSAVVPEVLAIVKKTIGQLVCNHL